MYAVFAPLEGGMHMAMPIAGHKDLCRQFKTYLAAGYLVDPGGSLCHGVACPPGPSLSRLGPRPPGVFSASPYDLLLAKDIF